MEEVRQDYRTAINEGRRSGRGKLVFENWDLLKNLSGASPATVTVSNSRSSFNMEGIDEEEEEEILGNNNDIDDPQYDDGIDFDDRESNKNPFVSETPRINVKKFTAKFIDNKRKLIQKDLSANQQDQAYSNMAREDLQLKQNLFHQLTEATRETNKAFGDISESIFSV